MPAATVTRHALRCPSPSMVTRHSKQTPIPQSGPRASFVTDLRNVATPAFIRAAATVEPTGARTVRPFATISTASRDVVIQPPPQYVCRPTRTKVHPDASDRADDPDQQLLENCL